MNKLRKAQKKKADAGVSLIELLVCILVLAILLTGFMKNFINAAKINYDLADKRTIQVTAENLMEGMKGSSLDEIEEQYGLEILNEFHLLSLVDSAGTVCADDVKILEPSEYGLSSQYAYLIDGLVINQQKYDVVAQIDGTKEYKQTDSGQTASNYNQYEMPLLTELDSSKVAMIDPSVSYTGSDPDKVAVQQFVENYNDWITENKIGYSEPGQPTGNQAGNKTENPAESQNGKGQPTGSGSWIDYSYTLSESSYAAFYPLMQKTVTITIDQEDTGDIHVKVVASYSLTGMTWSYSNYSADPVTVLIYDQTFSESMDSLYLLYAQSSCKQGYDQIVCKNMLTDSKKNAIPVNLYVSRQEGTDSSRIFYIVKDAESVGNIRIYSDLSNVNEYGISGFDANDSSDGVQNTTVEKEDARDYIYQITIEVYPHSEDRSTWNRSDQVYELTSTSTD